MVTVEVLLLLRRRGLRAEQPTRSGRHDNLGLGSLRDDHRLGQSRTGALHRHRRRRRATRNTEQTLVALLGHSPAAAAAAADGGGTLLAAVLLQLLLPPLAGAASGGRVPPLAASLAVPAVAQFQGLSRVARVQSSLFGLYVYVQCEASLCNCMCCLAS